MLYCKRIKCWESLRISSDGWRSYNYLDNADSGDFHIKHIYSSGSFGAGIQSTSYIESNLFDLS